MDDDTATPRTRNAAATRQAILDSAKAAFVRSGYDGAGLREIAAGAGVTAMLVNRYFGSKEALFAEVVAGIMSGPRVLTEGFMRQPDAAERLARAVVEMTNGDSSPLDGFLIMARSAASERAAEIGRAQIEANHQQAVAQDLSGDHRAERAALILALISGFQAMRQTIRLTALAEAEPEVLTKLLAQQFACLLKPQD